MENTVFKDSTNQSSKWMDATKRGCDSRPLTCPMNGSISFSNLTSQQLYSYYTHLVQRKQSKLTKKECLPSIANLRKVIYSDSILRMNWQHAISECYRTFSNLTGDDVIELIHMACQTPPSFSHSIMAGFPICSVLIEVMQNQNGRLIFSNKMVNNALKMVFEDYRKLLLSRESLEFMHSKSPGGWMSPEATAIIDYSQYICHPEEDHYGFANWNQWFLRKFKPGKRPVGALTPQGIHQDNVIVNSCESFPLSFPLQPQRNVKLVDEFWLKNDVYSLADMFAANEMGKQKWALQFEGGTVYQAYLSALCYHHWHSPVDGTIEDIYLIPGTYYLDQSQFIEYDETFEKSQSFLTAVATRLVIVINSKNQLIGKVAIVYVGMAEASGCIATVNIGQTVKKGQEIGRFEFGGSSHVIVFEKKANLKFSQNFYEAGENQKPKAVLQKLSSFLAEVLPE